MSSAELNRVMADPNGAVDRIELLETEIERLRAALLILTTELPEEMHTLDEPDEDWRVIVKMRAIAREALSAPRLLPDVQ